MEEQTLDTVAETFLKLFPVIIKYFLRLGDQVSDPNFSSQEYEILYVLKEYGNVPISSVGRRLEISKPRMTQLIDKLIAEELIERIPDKVDRRIINLALLPKGREFTNDHKAKLKASVLKRFPTLSNSEQEQFLQAMGVVHEMMNKTSVGDDIL